MSDMTGRRVLVGIYIFLGIYLLISSKFDGMYFYEFAVLNISYIIVGGVFVYSIYWLRCDLFEPLPITILLLLSIFTIAPIMITAKGVHTLAGVDFLGGCVKVTLVYIFSVLFFFIGYNIEKYPNNRLPNKKSILDIQNRKLTLFIMLIIWLLCIGVGILFQWKIRGMSLSYILSLGLFGSYSLENTRSTSLNFLLNFSYSAIVPWLYFMFLSKSRFLKLGMSFVMLTLFIVCGWRNVIIVMLLSMVVLHYTSIEQRPKFKLILVTVFLGLIFMGILGAVRYNLRNGVSLSETDLTSISTIADSVTYSLETNTNIYQPFYAIAQKYPSEYSFSYGKAIFWDTLVTFIPRALWPSKPFSWNNSLNTAIRVSTSDIVVLQYGMAVPSLGEFYVDFGGVGTVIISLLLGFGLKRTTKLYRGKSRSFIDLVQYSVLFGVLFVLVMRGATPNNFYYVVFLIWPNTLARFIVEKKVMIFKYA